MIWNSAENRKVWLQVLAKRHDRSDIATSVTVIRRRPYGHNVLVLEVVLVAFIDELMSARNEL